MLSDRKETRPEATKRILQRLTRELELANAVLDEWDQDRVVTKVRCMPPVAGASLMKL